MNTVPHRDHPTRRAPGGGDTTHGLLGDFAAPRDEAYAVIGAQGVVTSWSPGAERLLGYTADEVLGRRGTGLLQDEADAPRLVERCRAGEPLLRQTDLRHRDGSRVEVALHAQRLVSAGGEPQWLIRADSADSVRRQNLGRALLRGLFTESPFHIDVFDARLRYVAQNARRVKGFAERDFVGRTMREVAPVGVFDIDDFEARQKRILATGEALVANEVHARDPQDPDRYRAFSETIVPLRSDSREVIGLAHAVFEITDRVRARERLALVNDASSKIGSTLEVVHTAQELTDVATPVFADRAYVDLLDPVFGGEEPVAGPVDEAVLLRRVASSSVREGPAEEAVATGDIDPFTSAVRSVFTRALASNEPLLLTGSEVTAELAAADSRLAAPPEEFSVHSWLLVPMFARGAALGVVVFERFRGEHGFEADDVLLAGDLVARAAVCIDNARRYTRERTTALALQRSLLPQRMPVLNTVEAASRYLPAGGRTVLGGAWFDTISLSGARVALVVGDVPGNDLHSAVTMGRLRTAVRTLADLDLSPEELLTHLDDQVNRFQDEHGEGVAGRAVGTTCVYAVFDPLTRRCTVARAGHPAPARVRADGQVELLDLPDGLPPGRGGAPFEKGEATLDDGDLLVLYTDGSPTGQGQGTETNLASLPEALSTAGPTAAQRLDDICDTIMGHLPPARRQDDVALLVARVRGLEPDRHVTWNLADDPAVVSEARALATGKLKEWDLEDLEFTTELLVSELATNAIRYGSPPIQLRLIRDRSLICEVSDSSSTSPPTSAAPWTPTKEDAGSTWSPNSPNSGAPATTPVARPSGPNNPSPMARLPLPHSSDGNYSMNLVIPDSPS